MDLSNMAQWLNTTFYDFDMAIFAFLHQLCDAAGSALTPFFSLITLVGEKGIIFLVFGVVLLMFQATRKAGIVVILGVALAFVVVSLGIKDVVARPRPFDTVSQVHDWWVAAGSHAEDSYSFPSGHTAAAAAAMFGWAFAAKKPPKWLSLIIALLVVLLMGVSRCYLMAHYPSDVIAGALVGLICALIAFAIVTPIWNKVMGRFENATRFELGNSDGRAYERLQDNPGSYYPSQTGQWDTGAYAQAAAGGPAQTGSVGLRPAGSTGAIPAGTGAIGSSGVIGAGVPGSTGSFGASGAIGYSGAIGAGMPASTGSFGSAGLASVGSTGAVRMRTMDDADLSGAIGAGTYGSTASIGASGVLRAGTTGAVRRGYTDANPALSGGFQAQASGSLSSAYAPVSTGAQPVVRSRSQARVAPSVSSSMNQIDSISPDESGAFSSYSSYGEAPVNIAAKGRAMSKRGAGAHGKHGR